MKLYLDNGYLDAAHIDEVADRNHINFIIIIGKRQVGKTYNVLKLMLDSGRQFIFMRRVRPELDMLCKDVNSPFEKVATDVKLNRSQFLKMFKELLNEYLSNSKQGK